MSNPANFVINARSDVTQILDLVEQAQAIAAARVLEMNALGGGAAAMAGYQFSGTFVTEADMLSALSSLAVAFPTLLGDHATNLYKVKN